MNPHHPPHPSLQEALSKRYNNATILIAYLSSGHIAVFDRKWDIISIIEKISAEDIHRFCLDSERRTAEKTVRINKDPLEGLWANPRIHWKVYEPTAERKPYLHDLIGTKRPTRSWCSAYLTHWRYTSPRLLSNWHSTALSPRRTNLSPL